MKLPLGALGLGLLALACAPRHHDVRAGAGEVLVVATSTVGYGCVVPPFIAAAAAPADACGGGPTTYFFTDRREGADPAQGPPGRYRISGRWSRTRSNWSSWSGRAVEGAPPDTVRYAVFTVRDWCVEWASVPAAYREPSALAPADAAWRARICPDA